MLKTICGSSAPTLRRFVVLLGAGMLMLACTPIVRPPDAEAQPAIETPTTVPAEEASGAEGDQEEMAETPVPESSSPDTDPPEVQQAKADLADRLSVDTTQIEVVNVRDVSWRDGSMGCPQPDMMYTQMIVSGMEIILSVDGTEYHYHSGGNRKPFYCENPDPDGGIG